jgi:heat shock protein HtpX
VLHRDILISSIAATLAGAIMMLARMAQWAAFFGGGRSSEDDEGGAAGIIGLVVLAVFAPLAAMLIQMAISRAREYLADAAGAKISRKPWALADALEKLERAATALPMQANPATAHMFIVNPLRGSSVLSLFSTHPPVAERVARLRAMRIA